MSVGILSIQGNVSEHASVLRALGIEPKEIRTTEDIQNVTHLIIPGGESTVMSRFLFQLSDLGQTIIHRAHEGSLAIFGTCAGAILLAKNVTGSHMTKTLGLMDITIERNAYGSQQQSFETSIQIKKIDQPAYVAFIRAPIISSTHSRITILAEHNGHPILVQSQRLLAATFHAEARQETCVHALFLAL